MSKNFITNFLAKIFGTITWTMPTWLENVCDKIIDAWYVHTKMFISVIITLLTLIILGIGGYYWYQQLPKPVLVTANITPPPVTPIVDKKLEPAPLTIDFGLPTAYGFKPVSVAPLANIGKTITQGITTTPVLNGTWLWQTDKQLKFYPKNDWPAGQEYKINFAKNIFAKQIKMAKYNYKFSTLPFNADISELKFYQDLANPKLQKVVGTIQFNFPVDSKSLEQHAKLIMQEIKNDQLNLAAQQYPITFNYDDNKRTAYIQSAPLTLPTVPRFMLLVLDKGMEAASGTDKTTNSITKKVLIPDIGSFLQVNHTDASIVRDQNDNPQQVLNIETSLGVNNSELQKYLQVYLLPKDFPATSLQPAKPDYQWSKPGEVTDAILKQSTLVNLQTLPEVHAYPTLHSFTFKADTPRFLYVKINKGVKGFGDFSLTQDYATVIAAPNYPQEINFLHKGALMALSGEQKLTVLVRGIPLVKFSVSRVLPTDINHLISQTYGNYQNPKFLNNTFNQNDISEVFTEKRSFNINNPADLQYTTLDLNRYLGNKTANALGLFLLKAQAWDPKFDIPMRAENNRLILITDMGLLVKNNADSSHEVFVQSITQGTPVADAQVSLLGRNGMTIVNAQTDAQGHAIIPNVSDFKDEREPTVYLLQKGNDISFIPFNRYDRQLNYSRFDIGGVEEDIVNNHLTAYLFSDRGIYRPGDQMHIGVIVKQQFAMPAFANIPVEATIMDPRGNTVYDQKLALPANGFFTLDYKPASTAPTGQYITSLYLVKDNKADTLLGSTSVRVEEFLPDRLKMQAQLIPAPTANNITQPGWLSPIGLKAKIALWNLFGTPASDRRVTAKIILAPRNLVFKEYPAYQFVDPLLDPKHPPKVFTENLTETRTNAKGEAEFNLNLERFAKASYQLSFFAEGFEADGGRGVSAETTMLVTPLNYLVGYKADSDLNYLKQNSHHTVNFIAINPALKQIALNKLTAQLYNVKTVATLVKKPDGTYQYQSVQQELPLKSTSFAISSQGSDFTLPTQTIGDYALMLTDANGNKLSKLYFSVVGASGNPVAKNTELTLKLNKKEYMPGDTIELQITSPYTGAGLITIERDKVYAYKWFKADSTNSVQAIQIPADFKGNGYVNVAFVRNWDANEIYLNPLSYGVAPFNVSHDAQTIHVNLAVPAIARPGQNLAIQYSTDKPSQLIIFGVDEGILQVAGYKTPDPLAYFFHKHALTVDTAQIVDLILPKYIASREISAVGGDGALKELASNLNPFKRKTEAPVVFWSGIINSNNTTQTYHYLVPDYFNGSMRLMAVAVAADAAGSAMQQTQVRGYFVINPNVPTFVAPDDTLTISAGIANNIKGSGNKPSIIKLTTTPNLNIVGAAQQTVIIPEGQEKAVQFNLHASKQLGNATITFTVQQADKTVTRTATLSVRPARAYQTTLISGYDKAASKIINIPRQLYPNYRQLQASASNNPLILANGLQGYLDNFPYDCTEQLISKAFAQMAIAKQPLFAADQQLVQQKLNNLFQVLRQRQTSSGGFSYWPGAGDNFAAKVATVYAMDFLTEARLQGYAVPMDLFNAGINYLQEVAKQDVSSLEEARLQAYAIYLLTRNEIVTSNYLTNLLIDLNQNQKAVWQNDLTSAYIAATYKLLQNNNEADKLIKNYQINQADPAIRSDFYNSLIGDAQYITLLARHFPDRLSQLGSNIIVALAQGISSDRLNTLSAAYSAEALSAYAQSVSAAANSLLSISEILDKNNAKALVSLSNRYQKVNFSAQAKQIQFNNPNKQLYFYQINQTGYDKNAPTQPIKNGLEVFREYHDANNNVINNTTLGSEITSHIQIRTMNDQTISNVAIVDLLPGGFEVVPNSIRQNNCDYVDVREDRIIFYCPINPAATELTYCLRATNKGDYTVPPIFAQAMYNQSLQGQGVSSKITVK
jgi:hypothetical protein